MRRATRFALTFGLLMCMAGLGVGQNTNSADLRGTVTDSSGAVLPGVVVTVTNLDTSVSKQLVTNSDGLYDTASILPGNYQITFAKDGFGKVVRGPISVQVGVFTINGQLKVGSASQEITVAENVPLLKTETAEQSTTFEAQTLVDLPQVSTNGQNWGSFANLLPGASGAPSQPTASGKAGDPGIAIAVNGNLPFYNNFLQDGASTNLPISANVDIATFDTVSEVQISTSNFSAQYGIGGAVFNQITKSGTNKWHGSGYEYFSADYLSARDYFTRAPRPKPFLRYHNFGGSIGGPIFKDKLFFYFNADKIINHGTSTGTSTVPTVAMRNGDFSGMPTIYDPATQPAGCTGNGCARSAFPNNKITNIDPVAKALQAYFPLPTPGAGTVAPGFPGLVTNNYLWESPTTNPFLKFFGRIDYNISSKQRMNFSITQGDNPGTNTQYNNCPINCFSGDVDRYNAQISHVWAISPRTINEARFGFTKQGNWFVPQTVGSGFPQKIGLQYAKADVFPQININSNPNVTQILTPGTNAVYIENNFDPSDSVTMIRGKHILHFGGELMIYQANYTPWGNLQSGQFTFTGIYTRQTPNNTAGGSGYADFLLGDVQGWNVNNQPESGMRMKSPQVFIQDDYKLRPNLTVNIGLRYERQGGWSEVKNHIGTFDPTLLNPATNTLGAMFFPGNGSSRDSLQAPLNNIFLPRIGFAWSPGGTTVVRGGFGVYDFTWSLDTYGNGVGFGNNSSGSVSDQTNGVTPITILSGTGTNLQTGQPLPYVLASKSPSAYNGQGVNYNPYHTPVGTMKQWSASVERQIGSNMEAEVAYIGSHGTNLPFPVDINQVPLSQLSATAGQANRPYPQFQGISGSTNNAISNYNAFQAQIQRRFTNGLTFNANYTWSHFLDDQDSAGWGSRGGTQVYQNAFDPGANYGNSNFDQRHAVKGSVVYDLPIGKGRRFLNGNEVVDAVIGGWQTAATFVAHSGQPFTVTMASSNSHAQAGNQFPNVIGDWHLDGASINGWYNTAAFAPPAAGTFGNERRNMLVGPALNVVNFSLGKNFHYRERYGLQVRVDAQNILNHPSFSNPSTSISFNSAGVPTSVPTITSTTIASRAFQLDARFTF